MGAERLEMAINQAFISVCAPERVPIEDWDKHMAESDARARSKCDDCGEIDQVFDDDELPPGFIKLDDGTILCDRCKLKESHN